MPLSASAIRAIFRRSGAAGQRTCLFDDAPPDICVAVDDVLQGAGPPVLITWQSTHEWTAFTASEMVVSRDGRLQRIAAMEGCRHQRGAGAAVRCDPERVEGAGTGERRKRVLIGSFTMSPNA
ncbi:MAG TPA: hypothetical protein VJ276_15865 [Thermoanaerobaculia bacterium]|nr:hypothetical protein [Thermoanaerobaculia bacterium]